jgi:hypothetical protein
VICTGATEAETFRKLLSRRPAGCCDLLVLPAGFAPDSGAGRRVEVRRSGTGRGLVALAAEEAAPPADG